MIKKLIYSFFLTNLFFLESLPAIENSQTKRVSMKNHNSKIFFDAFSTLSSPHQKIGQVAINQGKLEIVNLINESQRTEVQKSLDEFNNREFLVIKTPPKNGERYELGAKEFRRDDPDFNKILIEKLESTRQIKLVREKK